MGQFSTLDLTLTIFALGFSFIGVFMASHLKSPYSHIVRWISVAVLTVVVGIPVMVIIGLSIGIFHC